MGIQPVDRNSRAQTQRTETERNTTAAPAQGAQAAQKAEAPAAVSNKPAAAAETDSYVGKREGTAAAGRGVDLASKAASIKEERRAARSESSSQLIGAAASSAPRTAVLSASSPEGQKAVKFTMDYLNQQGGAQGFAAVGDANQNFAARSIERDELGMTHVRMDRKHEGLTVFGEQVISHMDRAGKVQGTSGDISSIPAGVGKQAPKVSQDQALAIAGKDFNGKTDRPSTAERVVVKGDDGQYHQAWHVQMSNTTSSTNPEDRPRRMNYLIDAQTGKMMEKFNQIGGIELPHPKGLTANGTASPNAAIPDQGAINSTVKIAEDMDITKAKLNLDIDHTYKGDLKISLTSPSGKTAVIHDRTGGSTDNVKGDFDLSAFAGESSKGDWKLTVEDKAARDTGKLNNWSLNLEGTAKTPPPSPSEVTKTNAANLPIKDNAAVTSTIDVAENFDIDKMKLNLDIPHTYKGDLKVTLTSPSGKSHVVHDRAGGSADNVTGEFDVSAAFAGEKVQGQWKLTVEDKAAQDTGTLKSWGFTASKKPTDPGPGPGPGPQPGGVDDTTIYSGKVGLDATKNADGTYRLEEASRGKGIATYDAKGSQRPSNPVNFSDANNVWGEAGDPAGNKAAVDAHYGTQMTYDFYKNVLGRDSIDGAGEKLTSYVHVGSNYVNAFWDGTKMNYGDGDGRTAGPLTTLDIAGHEITHGLTERTAGLIYSGESGGLNEAMSDIMGTAIEWYASQKNSAVKFDWAVGEDAWTPTNGDPTDALRYMNDPTKDNYSVDHYSKYPQQTEVHGSSGIANNAFYLLAAGGTNRTSGQKVENPIGIENAAKIYYRALAHYMTPRTTFAQAREATIKAATDLFGANSPEAQRVAESWKAVGVGT